SSSICTVKGAVKACLLASVYACGFICNPVLTSHENDVAACTGSGGIRFLGVVASCLPERSASTAEQFRVTVAQRSAPFRQRRLHWSVRTLPHMLSTVLMTFPSTFQTATIP